MMINDDNDRNTKTKRDKWALVTEWSFVVVLSAAVGSASTLALVPDLIKNNVIVSSMAESLNLKNSSYPVRPVNLQINDAIVQAVKMALPSVVGIVNYQSINGGKSKGSIQEVGIGSGVIFDANGDIVTNYHVIQGASNVEVVLPDKNHVYAKVVGYDPYTDLAVLRIPASDISANDVAQFGNSATLQVGEPAIAIGNPAGLDYSDSVTAGVISATSRTMPVTDEATGNVIGEETVLQTDAAINPGNSGGPLVNINGQVVGINSSKIVARGFEGMGFSIPINEVKTIVNEILSTGHALHAALGVEVESLFVVPAHNQPKVPVKFGVWIDRPISAAAKNAGLEHGDVIVAINGQKVTRLTALRSMLWNQFKPGDTVTVTVYRGRRKLNFKVQLGELSVFSANFKH